MLGPNRIKAKDVKNCTYCCYIRCSTLIIQESGMPWPKTGTTPYNANLGLLDKCRYIKGLVVCYAVWQGSMIYWMDCKIFFNVTSSM